MTIKLPPQRNRQKHVAAYVPWHRARMAHRLRQPTPPRKSWHVIL